MAATRQLELEILTPVSIGSQEWYGPSAFVRRDGRLAVLSEDLVVQAVAKADRLGELAEIYEAGESPARLLEAAGVPLKEVTTYWVGLRAPQESDGTPLRRIGQTVRHPSGSPYVPGSSVKGSIRTALLFSRLRQDVANAAREVEREARMAAQMLERRFLRGGKGSPQYDALRFVEIGDSAPLKTDTVVVHHVEVCGSRQYPILLESLIPGVRVRLPWTCNIHPRLARELNLTRVATPVSESEVLRSLHEFASALLEQDERFFQAVGGSSDLAWATGELAHANDKTAPLIRLGRGKGWLSNTVNLLFKGRHSGAYRAAAERTRGRKRSNAEFPATRKVAVWDDGKRLPMGWAKVRVVG